MLDSSKMRASASSSANDRTTRTPARLARTRSLILPMASWFSRLARNIRDEKKRVTIIRSGSVTSDANVRRTEIVVIT